MAKGMYIGVDGVARKVQQMYVGVGGKARKVKKGYIGVGGVARLFYESLDGNRLFGFNSSDMTIVEINPDTGAFIQTWSASINANYGGIKERCFYCYRDKTNKVKYLGEVSLSNFASINQVSDTTLQDRGLYPGGNNDTLALSYITLYTINPDTLAVINTGTDSEYVAKWDSYGGGTYGWGDDTYEDKTFTRIVYFTGSSISYGGGSSSDIGDFAGISTRMFTKKKTTGLLREANTSTIGTVIKELSVIAGYDIFGVK